MDGKCLGVDGGLTALVDEEDYCRCAELPWRIVIGGDGRFIRIRSGRLSLHHFILGMSRLRPESWEVDHKNGNIFDNRKSNLRPCTRQQNAFNQKKRDSCTSKYKGVSWDTKKKRWHTHITINGKAKFLGYFVDEQAAAKVYNVEASRLFGEFAKPNEVGRDSHVEDLR